ncbi:hypothetical protein GCM10025886_01720 [Tetragenococcus halophilus subsp. flandriensis]|uniref:hypothetical protein n=1 Tax=Tetragenococcus halophilus TaxID=51669 RepID=UPI0023EA04E9|nr:hypothetical protein [Tetragenococcus halophilus]GMA07021.1 hypothetical protein GCM10025886_01720 [Tetragenococcus halophilus subsp. flandriensis]
METLIAFAIGIFLLAWIMRARSCFSRFIALVLFIFLLWVYRNEVANVVDQIGNIFNVDNISERFYHFLMTMWQRLIQWFGQLIQ